MKRIRTKNLSNEQERYDEKDIDFLINNSRKINYINDLKITYPDNSEVLINVNEMLTRKLWNFRGWKCYSFFEGYLLLPSNLIANANCNQEILDFDGFVNFIKNNKYLICKKINQ
ncbi:MAG: hypothetical protein NZZ41_00460 [Candidatus Dojkabacteria bacterium]|nr:hypothetical protein [Candidatus Dojkabacteria bacterium]